MVMMKTSRRWLGLLGAVVFASAVGVSAYSDSYSSTGCVDDWIGDGYCDQRNNNEPCEYDGGDCCSCTCTRSDDDDCGDHSRDFACIDPSAPCVDDDDITVDIVENCGYVGSIGDSYCDTINNNAICGYDGGDCCECTCTLENDDDYGCRGGDFQCIDPAAECVNDDDITVDVVENCGGFVSGIGDGYCHERNNNPECKYDGGDCCPCTCIPQERTDDWTDDYYVGCGWGFACIDPSAPCVNDDDVTIDQVEECDTVRMSNAYCDQDNNTPECNYDGGDCCSCTCQDLPNQECGRWGGFACIDPEAQCVDDDDITVDMFEACGWIGGIGDGYCNEDNNKPECNYDGGDCCSCTCVQPAGDDDYGCGRWSNFACIDPMAPCVDDDSVTVDMLDLCEAGQIGNGYCDTDNNIPECNYDGGDCCACTCEIPPGAGDDDYSSFCQYGFACIDPSADCVNDDDITVDMLDACDWVQGVGNGYCDLDMNIPECNYDGGDCCSCTCELSPYADDYSDGRYAGCNEFACIDPEAPCAEDDLITIEMIEGCDWVLGIGNGYCDSGNNNELCLFDGGDCCSCTCEYEYDDDYACTADGRGFDCKDPSVPCFGEEKTKDDDDFNQDDDDNAEPFEFVPWVQEGPLPTYEGAIEVGTKTEVGVTATGYDVRPGRSSVENGCGGEEAPGCTPENSRDGIASAVESRWSCSSSIVEDGGACQIEYTFAEPQNIVDIVVAFWKGNERIRTLDVHLNGVLTHTHESYFSGSVFNTLGVVANGVTTVMLESTGLTSSEWISLIEVLIFVKPEEEPIPTVDGAVEVGTKTQVGVTATAHDVRPGRSSDMNGCGMEGGDGCEGVLTRDGITDDIESRWSCASKLVEGEGPCQIVYSFAEPQDIMDIQVAFRKASERVRTLEVHLNGVLANTHESYAGSTFNTLGVSGSGVTTVTLESVGLSSDEWISLIEVLIFVSP